MNRSERLFVRRLIITGLVVLATAGIIQWAKADSTVYDGDMNYQGQVYGGQVYDEDNNYRGYMADDGDLYDGNLDYRGRVYGDDNDAGVILLED